MTHMPTYKILFALACLATVLFSCSSSDNGEDNNSVKHIKVPVHITIPVENGGSRAGLPGDPGTQPAVNLPEYAYIFVVTYATKEEAQAGTKGTCFYKEIHLNKTEWQYDSSKSEPDKGIHIYKYNGGADAELQEGAQVGRVYVALANAQIFATPPSYTNENIIKSLTFNIPDKFFSGSAVIDKAGLDDFMMNLYTTPSAVNYPDDLPTPYEEFRGKYYGTILNISSTSPRIDIICYHTAAKLDVMWNVKEEAQPTKKVTSLAATGLFRKNCSLFAPTTNTDVNTTDTYTENIATIDKGNEWNGRSSIYVIQRQATNKFNFNVGINGTSVTKDATVTYDTSTPYTPWMRGSIVIN
ncbi:MAG: hypothetical protein HUK08_00535 [Bacteroidaceae bacterium]|nr:hypothetical protein [Bacteroidaceae bacterium]